MKSEIERAASKFTSDLIELIKANMVARLTRPDVTVTSEVGAQGPSSVRMLAGYDAAIAATGDVLMTPSTCGQYTISYEPGKTTVKLDKPVTVPKGRLQVKGLERAVAKAKPNKAPAVSPRYAVRKSTPADVARKLDKHIGQALDRIREAGATGLKSRDLRKTFTEKRATQLLASLLKSGKVKRIGRTRGTRWVAVGAAK
jgi:hypothetical protein